MPLYRRCLNAFNTATRFKGLAYHSQGQVTVEHADAGRVLASVQGTYPYEVALHACGNFHNPTMKAYCSCPHFADGFFCKHLWAVLLAVEEDAIEFDPPGSGPIHFVQAGEDLCDFDTSKIIHLDEWRGAKGNGAGSPAKKKGKSSLWRSQLHPIQAAHSQGTQPATHAYRETRAAPRRREAWFYLNLATTKRRGHLNIDFFQRELRQNGSWGKIKILKIAAGELDHDFAGEDRELLELLLGNRGQSNSYYNGYGYGYEYYDSGYLSEEKFSGCTLSAALYEIVLPRLCATKRFGWVPGLKKDEPMRPLAWDGGAPWEFKLRIDQDGQEKAWRIWGNLVRDGEEMDLSAPVDYLSGGLLIFPGRLARLDPGDDASWLALLRENGPILIPFSQQDQFAEWYFNLPVLPQLELPAEMNWSQLLLDPKPRLSILGSESNNGGKELKCKVSFDYEGHILPLRSTKSTITDRAARKALIRNHAFEERAVTTLGELGLRKAGNREQADCDMLLEKKELPGATLKLTEWGWHVEAEGRLIRNGGNLRVRVTSGIDWFDLAAEIDFADATVQLPQLLAAARQGDPFILLDDGTYGLLPEAWLARHASLAQFGSETNGALRFTRPQAALLDAMLEDLPEVQVDQGFQALREKLLGFNGIKPRRKPKAFNGSLRRYQEEGLGWLHFLRDFGFGGCLADDMGLGKTIQVLALLQHRPNPSNGKNAPPSLVVVPRTIVDNWIEEAGRFAPNLRVLDYTGLRRSELLPGFQEHDLIVTTYGVLRRDIAILKEIEFEYAILDEAQTIKNPKSQVAKASRLLRARHRLALTGTPIENHVGDILSIFEFLNPGLLGHSQAAKKMTFDGGNGDRGSLELLAKALRPYILRRTKEQVLTELPKKMEQTLYVVLDRKQRKNYEELRIFYRASLDNKIKEVGIARSKIHILEALLRLRQAACHPGLVDKSLVDESSAKLEILIEHLHEVTAGGHKALVFSQFTSMLAILRKRLDQQGITYEYLDGRTRKRGDKVRRFQTDPQCPLFLISLKAGGLGLNLTAADYCFIMDPWWNPAVEAQAIDRAHRIGQTRKVFAYRIIARDTVEEKILQLQQDKQKLADSVISADGGFLKNITPEDIRLLLS